MLFLNVLEAKEKICLLKRICLLSVRGGEARARTLRREEDTYFCSGSMRPSREFPARSFEKPQSCALSAEAYGITLERHEGRSTCCTLVLASITVEGDSEIDATVCDAMDVAVQGVAITDDAASQRKKAVGRGKDLPVCGNLQGRAGAKTGRATDQAKRA